MEQRLLHTTAPFPQSSEGFMHCVCTVLYSSSNRQLLELKPGEIPDWDTSLDSNGKLKVGIVSISYYYCTEIGTQVFIWKVSAELSAASAGDLGQASAAHTLNCFITWLFASVWGKSSAAKSVDGMDDWGGTSSLLKIHWEAINVFPSPLLWVTAVLQTPHCLWACFGEALGRLSCAQPHKKSEPITPALRILHSLWLQLNFMFLFPELKLGWSSASTAFA